MKKLMFLLTAVAFLASSAIFTSCDEDDPTPDKPTVVVPTGIQTVAVNATKELTFVIEIPGGFSSVNFESAGGDFVVPDYASIDEDVTSGTITGVFTAGDEAGAGAVTCTVMDMNGKSDTGTIALEITD